MRICHLATFSQKSGIGIYASDLVKYIPQAKLFDWPYKTKLSRLFGPVFSLFDLRKACKQNDIIHIQFHIGEYGPLFLPLLMLIKGDCKIVLTLHEVHKERPLVVRYLNWVYNYADKLYVHTHLHKDFLPEKLQYKTKVIHMGIRKVDTSIIKGSKIRVLMPGFINRWKGTDIGIEAVEGLPNAELVIMGKINDKAFYNELQPLIESKAWITIKPFFVDNKAYDEEFRSADIILLPYRSITMSAILADAIAYHKLIVTSDIPEFKEYLKGVCPMARVNDSKDTTEKMKEALYHRNEIIKNVKYQSEIFSWKNIATIIINDYATLE